MAGKKEKRAKKQKRKEQTLIIPFETRLSPEVHPETISSKSYKYLLKLFTFLFVLQISYSNDCIRCIFQILPNVFNVSQRESFFACRELVGNVLKVRDQNKIWIFPIVCEPKMGLTINYFRTEPSKRNQIFHFLYLTSLQEWNLWMRFSLYRCCFLKSSMSLLSSFPRASRKDTYFEPRKISAKVHVCSNSTGLLMTEKLNEFRSQLRQ